MEIGTQLIHVMPGDLNLENPLNWKETHVLCQEGIQGNQAYPWGHFLIRGSQVIEMTLMCSWQLAAIALSWTWSRVQELRKKWAHCVFPVMPACSSWSLPRLLAVMHPPRCCHAAVTHLAFVPTFTHPCHATCWSPLGTRVCAMCDLLTLNLSNTQNFSARDMEMRCQEVGMASTKAAIREKSGTFSKPVLFLDLMLIWIEVWKAG